MLPTLHFRKGFFRRGFLARKVPLRKGVTRAPRVRGGEREGAAAAIRGRGARQAAGPGLPPGAFGLKLSRTLSKGNTQKRGGGGSDPDHEVRLLQEPQGVVNLPVNRPVSGPAGRSAGLLFGQCVRLGSVRLYGLFVGRSVGRLVVWLGWLFLCLVVWRARKKQVRPEKSRSPIRAPRRLHGRPKADGEGRHRRHHPRPGKHVSGFNIILIGVLSLLI